MSGAPTCRCRVAFYQSIDTFSVPEVIPPSRSATHPKKIKRRVARRLTSFAEQFNPQLAYYKNIYRKRILGSIPVNCSPESDFTVHTLVGERDILNALWALKTFYHFSGLRPKLFVHGDGSLSEGSIELLSTHFKNSTVIKRLDADSQMPSFLQGYKHLSDFRAKRNFHCVLKLLDILRFSSSENILVLDSDVLFFNSPEQIKTSINRGQPFYNRDYKCSYVKGAKSFASEQKIKLKTQVNAGLMFLNKQFYLEQLGFMDTFFRKIVAYPAPSNINVYEQTLHAILMSKCDATSLDARYQISKRGIDDSTVTHHFVNDGSRNRFYTDGLKRLEKMNFLDSLGLRQA